MRTLVVGPFDRRSALCFGDASGESLIKVISSSFSSSSSCLRLLIIGFYDETGLAFIMPGILFDQDFLFFFFSFVIAPVLRSEMLYKYEPTLESNEQWNGRLVQKKREKVARSRRPITSRRRLSAPSLPTAERERIMSVRRVLGRRMCRISFWLKREKKREAGAVEELRHLYLAPHL